METHKESPLKKHRRQPKIYIDLPSNGKFYKSGTVSGDVFTQLAVFSMTANDDILFKTPDALINGQATVKNIQSCIPSILDPWQVPMIDLDTILIAIRLSTYGADLSVQSKCPHCKSENKYDIPLQRFIDYFNTLEYKDTFVIDDFVIKTRPLTYREYTDNQKEMLAFQRALSVQAPQIEDQEQRELFEQDVVSRIADADAKVFHALKSHTERNVKLWSTPKHTVVCGNDECNKEHTIIVRLDQSDFFGKG